MKQIASQHQVPGPPPELRNRALIAARKQFDRPGQKDHTLLLSWAFAVTVLALFLIFWNPPIPGSAKKHFPGPNGLDSDPVVGQLYKKRNFRNTMIVQEKLRKALLQEKI